ncbi:MAG TPA: hypothetical protein VH496_21870 [Mycobacterium sp.]
MLSKVVTGVTAALMVFAPTAAADDNPPLPNLTGYPPISPVDFTAMSGTWYAFGTPDGLTCVIDKSRNAYGCSGPIPAAPQGANLVSGVGGEQPAFANTAAPVFAVAGVVKQLPPQTRLSYRDVSCAIDASSATVCVNSASQHGFMLSPAGSFTA